MRTRASRGFRADERCLGDPGVPVGPLCVVLGVVEDRLRRTVDPDRLGHADDAPRSLTTEVLQRPAVAAGRLASRRADAHHRWRGGWTAARRHRRGLGAHPRGIARLIEDPAGRSSRRSATARRSWPRSRPIGRTCRSSTSGCRRPSATKGCGRRSRPVAASPGRRSSCSASTSSASTRRSCSPTAPVASATCSRTASATSPSSWTRCDGSPAAGRRSTPRSSPS